MSEQQTMTTLVETVREGMAVMTGEMTADTMAQALPTLHFTTGLATVPQRVPGRLFGLATPIVVPPGTWAVVYLPGGETRVLTSGYHVIWAAPGPVLAQWVDARWRQLRIGPVEGWSADKWRVRLWLTVELAARDPLFIALHREPLMAINAATHTAALTFIERHSYAQITGDTGIDEAARWIGERLRNDPTLTGFEIIGIQILDRQGDERHAEAAMAATIAAAQIDEEQRIAAARHRARLHALTTQAVEFEHEHRLRMQMSVAEAREQLLIQQAEVQRATLAAQLDLISAQIRAQVAEIARDEQVWQSEQARFQQEWERLQQQLLEAHQTDQAARLLAAQRDSERIAGEVALGIEERRANQLLALIELQQRLEDQRLARAQEAAERREHHERVLLELRARHEHLVLEQMARLSNWQSTEHSMSSSA
ncbi:SPFH domain-containing protein [Chloroflexus sp.]|uniref:SPFH domain-containing protein n=1 Tax=Chloroflexus sp. TaxID=1904827 RepID=UPI00261A1775|nr:SPFH domain-containing protein [uncultured Chloroflexus sp.]